MLLVAFFTACVHDNITAIQTYLSTGNDVDSKDSEGRTGLHMASSAGAEAAVAYLLQSGADLTARSHNGRTAFMSAVLAAPSDSTRRIASLLLPLTLHSQRDRGMTPETNRLCTLFAALSGQPALDTNIVHGIHLLLSAGAPVDQRDAYGRTALMLAVCREAPTAGTTGTGTGTGTAGREAEQGASGAMVAGIPPHLEALAQDLIGRGCDLTAVDREGMSALRHAVTSGNKALVRALLDSGWPISRADCAPLHNVAGAAGVVREAGARAVEGVALSPWTVRRLHGWGRQGMLPGAEGAEAAEGDRVRAPARPPTQYEQLAMKSLSDLPIDSKGRPILSRLGGGASYSSTASGRYRYGGYAYCPPFAPHCDATSSTISASLSATDSSPSAEDEGVVVGLGSHSGEGGLGGDVSSEVAFRELRARLLSSLPHTSEGPEASHAAAPALAMQPDASRYRRPSPSSALFSHGHARASAHTAHHNGGLSEDEALALALQLSVEEASTNTGTESVAGRVSSSPDSAAVHSPVAASFSYSAGAEVSAGMALGTLSSRSAHPSVDTAGMADAERVWRRRSAMVLAYYGAGN